MNAALFGGTFDPVHEGHLNLARRALDEGGMDLVIFMPAKETPRKKGKVWASEKQRLEMVRLAMEDAEQKEPERKGHLLLSDWEISKPGFTYTIDTLRYLQDTECPVYEQWRKLCPERTKIDDIRVFLLLSDESADEVKNWKCGEEILSAFPILSFFRKETSAASSTEIREAIALGKPERNALSPSVRNYIEKHGLYLVPQDQKCYNEGTI